jgi:hypothetical protein
MVVLDVTIVNIALPSAQRALQFDRRPAVDHHGLCADLGSLLPLGGKLGDLFGRKWTLVAGLLGFAGASAIGGWRRRSACWPQPGHCRIVRSAAGPLSAVAADHYLQDSPDRPKAIGT